MMAPERPGPEDEPCVALRGVSISDLPIYSLQGGMLRELKEGDGASIELAAVQDDQADKPSGDDNDLTSLSWLQDKNLLKEVLSCPDMSLQSGAGGSQESPTSDFVDDTTSELADSTCSSGNSPPSPLPAVATPTASPARQKHPQHMPYDPQVHTTSKPPYSFSCLIFMAIEDSMQRALPVKDIYTWVLSHFPYFKNAPTGWKNSVRHNLSLNKCFRKVDKAPNLGKGSLWMVDPMYRPNLLQALQKAPFHPYTTLDRISMVTSRQTARPTERTVLARNDSSLKPSGGGRLPDPDLFPFLSRRLAASGADAGRHCTRDDSDSTDGDSLDDVDAAAAMMALKHGPRLLATRRDLWPTARESAPPRRKKSRGAQQRASDALVITTSPSEDHTYSAGPTPGGPTVSPDEAFGEGSDTDDSISRPRHYYSEVVVCKPAPISYFPPSSHSDSEEQRKIAEGADALLNLAGIPTLDRCYPGEFLSTSRAARKRHLSPPLTPPAPATAPAFRPRILRATRPKKEAKSRQRGNSRKRKLNNNNNSLVANGNAKLKVRNSDSVRQLRSEEKLTKNRR